MYIYIYAYIYIYIHISSSEYTPAWRVVQELCRGALDAGRDHFGYGGTMMICFPARAGLTQQTWPTAHIARTLRLRRATPLKVREDPVCAGDVLVCDIM